ncbi:MAG: hypothetical protein HC828_19675 [Blastochloris sp.]|nr:hypothetical protein [Blastochloris sp.]
MHAIFFPIMTVLIAIGVSMFGPPTPTLAQEPEPALIVRLRDVQEAGVAGATVQVTDASGSVTLGRAVTDATGSAAFGPLPASDVRVLVQGRLADGTPLAQPGADAQGLAVILGAPALRLELRSETDGTVVPDPTLSLTLEPGIPFDEWAALDPALVPPAPPAPADLAATVAAIPTVPTASLATPEQYDTNAPLAESPTAAPAWFGFLLLGVLMLTLGTIIVLEIPWGRS